jgi:hypothetical protein
MEEEDANQWAVADDYLAAWTGEHVGVFLAGTKHHVLPLASIDVSQSLVDRYSTLTPCYALHRD